MKKHKDIGVMNMNADTDKDIEIGQDGKMDTDKVEFQSEANPEATQSKVNSEATQSEANHKTTKPQDFKAVEAQDCKAVETGEDAGLVAAAWRFFKGVIVGVGGVAPGLSGSILLTIFGLYQRTIDAIGNVFSRFKANVIFLLPLFAGFGVGVLLFSKIINLLLQNFEPFTRFAFFGLVLGTIPLFFKEVRKKQDWDKKYFIPMAIAFVVGLGLFILKLKANYQVSEVNFLQSILLGFAVAGSTIVPGVDSASILSALGLYEVYISSIDSLNFAVLIPAGLGLGIGVLSVSFLMSRLLKKHYTLTFSVIFGLFLAITPSVLNSSCGMGWNLNSMLYVVLAILGFCVSFFLSRFIAN